MITAILKVESLVALLVTLLVYWDQNYNWLWMLLVLVPDVSMVGYLQNSRAGALIYNLGHTYVFPLLLLGVALFFSNSTLSIISMVWLAHISLDRTLGYGLKYPTGFKDTHLGRIGHS